MEIKHPNRPSKGARVNSEIYQDKGLGNIQLYGNAKYQKLVDEGYSPKQQELYRRAVYGLSSFTKEELASLTEERVTEVIITFKRSQKVINRLKEEACDKKLKSFLLTMFHKSTLARDIAEYRDPIKQYNVNPFSFKELNISKELITEKLILAKVLPEDYYEL